MTFRAGGLISGLDTNTIIDQLLALERQPITKLENRQKVLDEQKSIISSIESALKDLQSLMDDFSSSSMLSYKAESSNSSAVTVTARAGASAGTHQITVHQLARAEQDRSAAFSSASDQVKAGTLTITAQGYDAVEITIEEGDTLADVAYKINTSGARVSASVIDTGSAVYLTIYARDSGHAVGGAPEDALIISESYTGSSGAELNFTETQTAQNAKFTLDGLLIERRSNTVSDAVSGLEIRLLSATGEPTAELRVDNDADGLKENLKKFVEAYNKVASQLQAQLSYSEGQSAAALFGDSSLRQLFSRLQSVLSESVSNPGGTITTLRGAGLKLGSGGSLVLDDSEFEEAAASDFIGIDSLFTSSGGILEKLESVIDSYTDPADGVFKYKKDGISRQNENLADQIERMELRLEAYEKHLVEQFTYMETVISQLKSQQNSIAGIYSLLQSE